MLGRIDRSNLANSFESTITVSLICLQVTHLFPFSIGHGESQTNSPGKVGMKDFLIFAAIVLVPTLIAVVYNLRRCN